MIKKYFLFCLCLFCFSFLSADDFENVKVISVYDGDTFKVNLPCKEDIFCKDISVRVYGIDTPEIKTKNTCEKTKAKEAQTLTKNIFSKGPVILKNCQRDKYFRLLCEVSVLGSNQGYDLSEELVNNNLAVRYYGETKAEIDWCKYKSKKKTETNSLQEIWESVLNILKDLLNAILKSI